MCIGGTVAEKPEEWTVGIPGECLTFLFKDGLTWPNLLIFLFLWRKQK